MTQGQGCDVDLFPVSWPEVPEGLLGGFVANEFDECHGPDSAVNVASSMDRAELAAHIAVLEKTTTATRYSALKKSEAVVLQAKFETFQIQIKVAKEKGAVSYINMGDIHEIRTGDPALRTKEFATSPDKEEALFMTDTAICIMHGTQHRLKQLAFVLDSEEEFESWSKGLLQFTRSHASGQYTSDKVKE